MEEARDLLRDVKRRRQIFPQKGVLKKTGVENSLKPLKRLRFAEECNEIYEIPVLDSSPSHIVMAMHGGEPVISGLPMDEVGSVDWIEEANRAATQRPTPALELSMLEPSEEIVEVDNSFGEDPGGTSKVELIGTPISQSYSSSSPSQNNLANLQSSTLYASSLENLRALAAAMPIKGVVPLTSNPATTLSDHALETLLWED